MSDESIPKGDERNTFWFLGAVTGTRGKEPEAGGTAQEIWRFAFMHPRATCGAIGIDRNPGIVHSVSAQGIDHLGGGGVAPLSRHGQQRAAHLPQLMRTTFAVLLHERTIP